MANTTINNFIESAWADEVIGFVKKNITHDTKNSLTISRRKNSIQAHKDDREESDDEEDDEADDQPDEESEEEKDGEGLSNSNLIVESRWGGGIANPKLRKIMFTVKTPMYEMESYSVCNEHIRY